MSCYLLLKQDEYTFKSLLPHFFSLAITVPLFVLFTPRFFRWNYFKQIKKRISLLEYAKEYGKRRLSVSENGIEVESKEETTNFNWIAFIKLAEVEGYFFLYKSPADALIIPQRSIPAGEIENLRSLLQKNIAKQK